MSPFSRCLAGARFTLASLFAGAVLCAPAGAADSAPIPAATFASSPRIANPELSPDGKHMVVTQRVLIDGREVALIYVYRTADMAVMAQVRLPVFHAPANYWWVSNSRIVVAPGREYGSLDALARTGELMAMDLDGTHSEYLYGYNMATAGRQVRMNDRGSGRVVGIAQERDGRFFMAEYLWNDRVKVQQTQLYSINASGGARKLLAEVPVENAGFLVQRDGTPRYAYVADDQSMLQVLQYDDATRNWLRLNGDAKGQLTPLSFTTDDRAFYARQSDDGGPECLVLQSVATGERKLLAADPVAGITRIEWNARRSAPIAVSGDVGIPRPRYIDPASPEAQLHAGLTAQFPGNYVSFTQFSDDGSKLLFRVHSDRDPGAYYLLDRQTNKAQHLFDSMPWIDPARMGERRPVQFKARDGLDLYGYLTLPPGGADKKLPLILLPHGGPHGVMDDWFFDRDAQFLASRGYAVLQVNFRGSGGRGEAFGAQGWRHWGDRMPDDLIDGVRWTIGQGVADPSRVCAYGASYGAYAALMVAVRAPELFKCAVGYAGVYDLPAMYDQERTTSQRQARNYWMRVIGEDAAELERFSPARQADKLTVPVLLVHGEDDKVAEFRHAKAMRDALTKAGKPFEFVSAPDEGHGFTLRKNRVAFYEKLEAFLARNLAPK